MYVHVLKINTNAGGIKNTGDKEKEDNMKEKKPTPLQRLDLYGPQESQLKTGYLNYTTKTLVHVLEKFCESPVGAEARVMMVLPEGRNPLKKEFNFREVKLVENKIVGATEKYRLVIIVE